MNLLQYILLLLIPYFTFFALIIMVKKSQNRDKDAIVSFLMRVIYVYSIFVLVVGAFYGYRNQQQYVARYGSPYMFYGRMY